MLNFLMFHVPKEYHVNPFEKDFILNPFSEELTKKQQKVCLITSIALGILTLGIYHLVLTIRCHLSNRKVSFKPVEKDGKIVHIRPPEAWKSKPAPGKMPDFSYVKPVVDTSSLGVIPEEVKTQVEERCLHDMRAAMKVLDPSIVDAANQVIRNPDHPEFLEIVNTFSGRVLDLYKAYTEIHIADNLIHLPMEIGVLKAAGFSHQDLLDLREPCQWYQEQVDHFHEELLSRGIERQEAQTLSTYISSQKYRWNQNALLNPQDPSPLDSQTLALLNRYDESTVNAIEACCNSFSEALGEQTSYLSKLTGFNFKIDFIQQINPNEKEQYKKSIAEWAKQEPKYSGSTDFKLKLLQEIQHRFELRNFETGAVESPLRLLNILEGKYDEDQPDQYFRTKLFFCYGSKGLVNEICQSSELVARINEKLTAEGKGWNIDTAIMKTLARNWNEPVYQLGLYANENNIGKKTRHYLSFEQVQDNRRTDPNLTYADAERIARGENVTTEELNQRFRLQLYASEEMALLGTTTAIEQREMARRRAEVFGDVISQTAAPHCSAADTGFFESPLAYQKKTQQIAWHPGKHFFQLHDEAVCKSRYLKGVKELGLPQYAGISGSSDQTFTMAGLLGINSREELMLLRFVYLPWMSGYEDHTADEIMTGVKAFGLEYKQAPDYYKQIYPDVEEFIPLLQEAQRSRGYELPDYYLSKEHAEIVCAEEIQQSS